MDKKNFAYCESCINKSYSNDKGLICSITKNKPEFSKECGDFEFDKKNHIYSYNSIVNNSILTTRKDRILNYLIDSVSFIIIGWFLSPILISTVDISPFLFLGIIIFILAFYYFLMELFFNQTIGKIATKTIVVNAENFEKPNRIQILIRSLFRLPIINTLDVISFMLGYNLHDNVSKTLLVKADKNLIEKSKILIELNKTFANML
ncbi:RDD family protein [Crocinitomix algicola]|uniref:RDD family protein n=1 Tax=Crocinitomix algicola TaxID=1740263 RepID=UPI000832CE37|nr:RDD family protein [Crocinitomix algicola]